MKKPSEDPIVGYTLVVLIGYTLMVWFTGFQNSLNCRAKGGEYLNRSCVINAETVR